MNASSTPRSDTRPATLGLAAPASAGGWSALGGRVAALRKRFFATRFSGLVLILIVLGLWQVSALYLTRSPNWPPFTQVAAALVHELAGGKLASLLLSTLYRMIVGFAIGAVLGIAVGLGTGCSRFLHDCFDPIFEFLRPLPVPGIIPPLILLLGLDDPMKIFVVAFSVFFPVAINVDRGARAADPTLIATARTFRKSRAKILWSIIMPASLPYTFSGLRVSLALALIVTIIAEMISGAGGLGYYLVSMQYAMRPADMYACVVLIAAVGYFLNLGFVLLERRLLHWYFVKAA